MAGSQVRAGVPAPGAMTSPQRPGMIPDRAELAGHEDLPVPPATTKRRPLTQYGSAEAIVDVFGLNSGEPVLPEDFEQADASSQEMRSANPAQRTPVRPLPRPLVQAEVTGGPELGETPPQLTSGS